MVSPAVCAVVAVVGTCIELIRATRSLWAPMSSAVNWESRHGGSGAGVEDGAWEPVGVAVSGLMRL